MAIRNIIQMGDPTLRKKSFPVTDFGAKTWELLEDMKDTLKKAKGAGLAAPQVGVLRRIFIVDVDDGYFECINPEITKAKGRQVGEEACLSVHGRQGVVERPAKITVTAKDRFGKPFTVEVSGFTARAFCHEYDHLDGILYVDRAKKMEETED